MKRQNFNRDRKPKLGGATHAIGELQSKCRMDNFGMKNVGDLIGSTQSKGGGGPYCKETSCFDKKCGAKS